jgi:hypothetical protein
MKTVNTREIQKDTRGVRERLMAGESLAWVVGKRTVAYLTPATEAGPAEPWPDLLGRLERIYGRNAASGQPASDTVYADRE